MKTPGNSFADVSDQIVDLKRRKNALLLAHYYVEGEVQDVADFVGDSFELAKRAKASDAPLIVFAGVHFMAEGTKILNPRAKVVLPNLRAGCSLSDSCSPAALRAFKAKNPEHFVISYINCSAGVKAESDVICTSSNAVKIVERAPRDRPILFAPDRNLGAWVSRQTGREMELWPGACIVHETFSERKLIDLKVNHPQAEVIAHPECEPALLAHAAFVGSTSQLLRRVVESAAVEFIVLTEAGILHKMKQEAPGKVLIPGPAEHACSCNECPFMKLNTVEAVLAALESEAPEVEVPAAIREAARIPLERMLEWGSS